MHPLKKYRDAQGLTQVQLAELLGVTQAFISYLESGDRGISEDTAERWEQITSGGLKKSDLVVPKAVA